MLYNFEVAEYTVQSTTFTHIHFKLYTTNCTHFIGE